MNVRDLITWTREKGTLVEIEQEVSPHLELARILNSAGDRPVHFKSLVGYPGWQAVGGICARREAFAQALDCQVAELIPRMAQALAGPTEPPLLATGPCQKQTQASVNLTQLPLPHYHPLDGGRYVTAGILVVKDPDLGQNVAIHRLMLLDERRFVARLVEGRGTHTAWTKSIESGEELPVAIAIGCPIHILLAAAMSPPKGVDEFGIAQAMAPTPLVACQHVDLSVPADAEIVLEGRLTSEMADEGRFPDLTETMDAVRSQPVIEIDHVTHRGQPIFQALLSGGLEHRLLMGMPREPTIYAAVNERCRCTDIALTPGGASWLHAVVQIDKQDAADGQKAIAAAFIGHSSLKHVVIVDTDIDIHNPHDVEWAIATRFQADRDLVVMRDQPSSSLDPSATHVPGEKSRTTKVGLDATAPLGIERRSYEKVSYAVIDLDQYDGQRGT